MSVDATSIPNPRYPIGKFSGPAPGAEVSARELDEAVRSLAELPEQLRNAVEGLDDRQLATPYREGGWTLRQVVHHVADSHMTAFGRIRKALTEDWPPVAGYQEAEWAKLHDSTAAPLAWSLDLLEGLHARWVMMLQSLTAEQWQRGYVHSEAGRLTLPTIIALYGWHSRHHVAHITHLRAARGW
jgi:uncharacterized damage-inducible protein DinB